MNIDELTVGELKQIAKLAGGLCQPQTTEKGFRIVVLERGHVAIGEYERAGDRATIRDAAIIRRWGTTKGLGEIAGGPTDKTIVDYCGTIRDAVVLFTIDAIRDGWRK